MSTNISRQKRDDLIVKIKAIRAYISGAPQDENTAALLSCLGELEKELEPKKYGLVFAEHSEDIYKTLSDHTPVLTEEKDLSIDNGGQMHHIIEGDNLAALELLGRTHREKIDVIYIDPPYNTGNRDFTYDDAYTGEDGGSRHGKWISFISRRLELAKSLLSPRGLIFISINDSELYGLKLLCDDIFGADNFVANLVWANREGGGSSDTRLFRIKHEYILCYAGDIQNIEIQGVPVGNEDRYRQQDEFAQTRGKYYLQKLGMGSIQYSPSLDYPIETPDGGEVMPADNNRGKKACWRWSQGKFQWGLQNGFIVFKKDKRGVWTVYTKQYLNCDNNGNPIRRTQRPDGIILDYSSTQGAKAVRQIFGRQVFSYPKDVNLIKWLLERVPQSNSCTVLDFFAGSGTTGHAVMKLNAGDGGNRRFILCNNNENNICREITYERIRRVIKQEGYSGSLKYYRIDYVPKDIITD